MCDLCGFPAQKHDDLIARRDVLALGAAFSAAFAMPAMAADDTPPPKPQNVHLA